MLDIVGFFIIWVIYLVKWLVSGGYVFIVNFLFVCNEFCGFMWLVFNVWVRVIKSYVLL